MKRIVAFALCATVVGVGRHLFGLPVFEPFNYPSNAVLVGQTNPDDLTWVAAGSGVEQPAVQPGNLAVAGLASPTGNRTRIRAGAGTSARLPFGGAVSNGVVFFSFAMRIPDLGRLGTGTDFMAAFTPAAVAQTNTPTNGFTRVFLRSAAGRYQIGLSKSTSATNDIVWHPTTLSSNDTVFVVGSYTFTAGPGNDTARLWINPSPATFGLSDAPGPTLAATAGLDVNQLASFVLFQKAAPTLPALLQLDELRLGATWGSVTRAAPQNDLQVRLFSDRQAATVGHTFTFVCVVDNVGAVGAENVRPLITVPPNLRLSSLRANCTQGTYQADSNTVTWEVGPLLPGRTAAAQITLTPTRAGDFNIEAWLTPATQDGNPQNDNARLLVPVRPNPLVNRVTPRPTRLSISRDQPNNVRLDWSTLSNVTYRLECTPKLPKRRWQILSTFRGMGTPIDQLIPIESTRRFYRVAADSLLPWLGSWGQYVKTNSVETGAWRDDIPALVQALIGTEQNFCVYPIDEDIDWLDFKLLLDHVKTNATEMRIFAAITAPHLGGGANGMLRWLTYPYASGVTNGDCFTNGTLPVKCDTSDCTSFADYHACEKAYIEQWLDAWKNAARCLSYLSLSYSNLVGFVINDFDTYVESVDFPSCLFGTQLTRSDVSEIANATHSGNTNFQFWPTCYYQNFGQIIGDGHVLGANYGVELFSDEEMRVDLSFDLDRAPLLATLQFFHADTVADCKTWSGDIFKRVYVNGTEVWSEAVGGDQIIQRFNQLFLGSVNLHSGANTVSLVFDPDIGVDSENTGCSGVGIFWRVWDVKLSGIHVPSLFEPIESFSATFSAQYSTTAHADGYYPPCGIRDFCGAKTNQITNTQARAECTGLPDDSINGFGLRRLVAAPSAPYLIHDLVDGIVAPFYETTNFPSGLTLSCDIGSYSPFSYDSADYQALLESTHEQLRGAGLMALNLGMDLPTNSLTLPNLEDQIEIGTSVADYTGLWNMPLGVYYLDDNVGIFCDRRNEAGAASFSHTNYAGDSIDWNFLAYWPGRQSGVPGWFVRWQYPAKTTTELIVDLFDNIADSGSYKGLTQSVAVNSPAGKTLLFSYDLAETVSEAVRATWPMTITVAAGESLELSLEQDTTRASPSSSASAYFYVTDASGVPLGADSSGWEFSTGVDDKVLETFTVETDLFSRLRK